MRLEVVEQADRFSPARAKRCDRIISPRNVKRSSAAIDEDWDIPNLEKVNCGEPSLKLSQTIWRTLQLALSLEQLEATISSECTVRDQTCVRRPSY